MTQNIVIACLNFNPLWKGVLEHISIANTKREGWGCVQWIQLRWEVIVRFVDIGEIDNHHCLNFLFIGNIIRSLLFSWFTDANIIDLFESNH
jgi:hypothetical protein